MSSTPQYLKCYHCKANPSEFTFLNCNHILCSDCFLNHVEKNKKYSLVNCSCGGITYFNDENQIIQSFKASNISKGSLKSSQNVFEQKQTKANMKKERSTEKLQNLEFSSIFSLQRERPKYRIQNRQLQRQQTNNNQYSILLNKKGKEQKQFSKQYKNLQKTALQSSIQQEQQKYRSNDWINQFSTHNICQDQSDYVKEQKQFNKNRNRNKRSKNKDHLKNNQYTKSNQNVHEEFKSELNFLKILFQKQINQVEYKFRSILQGFRQQYQKIQKELKTLYLQNILTKESSSLLNLSLLIKMKYSNQLGNKIKLLKDQLFFTEKANLNQLQNKNSLIFDQIKQRTNKHQHQLIQIQSKQNRKQKLNSPFEVVKQQQVENQYRSRIKNCKFNKNQKLNQRLNQTNNNQKNHYYAYNSGQLLRDNHRVQTEYMNMHTHVKKPKMNRFYQRSTNERHNEQESYTQQNFNNRSYLQEKQNSLDQQRQRFRNHIIYYSPPLPYCYKHYQKKSRQARNYINQIENLCKAKKLKNSKDLFKKFKNDKHNFSYRFQ